MSEHTPKRRPGGLFERISSVIVGSSGGEVIDSPPADEDEKRLAEADTVDAATLEELREQRSRGVA